MPEADRPLYFTIDEKSNSVDLTEKGLDLITKGGEDPNFFILPNISVVVAEVDNDQSLSAEARLEKKEKILTEYSIKLQRIHTVNQLVKAYALFEKDDEYIVVDSKVMIVDEQTGRVMDGRRFSDGLHQALEAKENVKIEDATQTYATITLQNYFRMYHKLAGMTGTAETEAGEFWEIYKLDVVVIPTNRPIARADEDDKVYKTVREKFNAVAEEIQAMVAKGRPVLVGTTSVEISEVLSRMLQLRKIPHQVLNAKQHAKEADIVAQAGLPGTVTIATNMAGRGTDIKLTPEAKAAGGLAIIGTERHESRRVDRQLRGRAGRQGDPGSSQFYVSLEDNLMRLFGSDKIARAMDRVGHEEGDLIQHSIITSSIGRAQRKVEENNFSIRKRLLEYDDVMNMQRSAIYKRRKNALYGDRLELDILGTFYDVANDLVNTYSETYDSFVLNCINTLGIEPEVTENELSNKKLVNEVVNKLYKQAYNHYLKKNESIRNHSLPIINQLHNDRGAVIRRIMVPFTDGKKTIQVAVDLEEAVHTECRNIISQLEQVTSLYIIDQAWKEHLREMEDLKQYSQNAVYEQKDPLLVYKKSAFEAFITLKSKIDDQLSSFLSKAVIYVQDSDQVQEARQVEEKQKVKVSKEESRSALASTQESNAAPRERQVQKVEPATSNKVHGRNDKVTVRYSNGTIKRDVKYKSVEDDVQANKCVVIDE